MHKVDPMFPFRMYWLQAEDNTQSLVQIRYGRKSLFPLFQ